jgi:type I restriction enzyme S subunit
MRDGWKSVKIEDIAKVVNGGTPKTKVAGYWGGAHLWITPAEMGRLDSPYLTDSRRKLSDSGLQQSSATLVPPHSVILSTRAPIGHLIINSVPMAFNQGCRGIVPSGNIHYKYLYYFLSFSVDLLNDLGSGTTFKELAAGKLKKVEIPLPSLPEQIRIVAILDEAFAGIATAVANTEKNLANARELFASFLNAVFSPRNAGWVKYKLEDLVVEGCSLSYGIVQPGKDLEEGLPVVRPTDLMEKVIGLNKLKKIDPSLARAYTRTTLHGGDLLLCVRGSTGTLSIASRELKGGNVTRGIVPIRLEPSLVSQDFGYYLFSAPYVQEQIAEKTYGAALMQINIRDVRKLHFHVPSRQKQNELLAVLDDLSTETSRLETAYQQKLAALAELKQSLLQRAFSGELIAGKEAPTPTLREEEVA